MKTPSSKSPMTVRDFFRLKVAIYFILSATLSIGIGEDETAPDKEKKNKVNSNWNVLQQNGRGYVSIENIFKFYSFKSIEYQDDAVLLKDKGMNVEFRKNSSELRINKILFHTSYPMIPHDGSLLVSTLDLAKLLDPVVRPSRIKNVNTTAEFFLLFDDLESNHPEHFQSALESAFSSSQIPTESLVSSSSKERTAWLNSKPAGKGSRIIVFRFNVAGLPINGIRTKALAPLETKFAKKDNTLSEEKPSGNKFDRENIALATAIHSHLLCSGTKFQDSGIARTLNPEMKKLTCPAIVIEFGPMSGGKENPTVLGDRIASATGKYMTAITR